MGKRLPLILLLCCSLLTWFSSTDAAYKVKKKPVEVRPIFASAEEERRYDLKRGKVFSNGGYLRKGVWGEMEGVVQAPPHVVWMLFVEANNWKSYRLPHLADSRAISEDLANGSRDLIKADDFYALLGNRVFSATEGRRKGGTWVNYTFQYYDLPWPVANKWVVLKNVNDETHGAEGIFRCQWSKVGGSVNTMNGKMTLTPFEGDQNVTLLEYRIESDPASHVPKFLLKWGIKKSMPAAIKIIRRESEKLNVRRAPLLKIQ